MYKAIYIKDDDVSTIYSCKKLRVTWQSINKGLQCFHIVEEYVVVKNEVIYLSAWKYVCMSACVSMPEILEKRLYLIFIPFIFLLCLQISWKGNWLLLQSEYKIKLLKWESIKKYLFEWDSWRIILCILHIGSRHMIELLFSKFCSH